MSDGERRCVRLGGPPMRQGAQSDLDVSRVHMRSACSCGMAVTGTDALAVSSSRARLMCSTASAPTTRPKYNERPSAEGYAVVDTVWPSKPASVDSESSQVAPMRRATLAE